jgi:glycosyltransferase involved in cell wall biosynthesis
MMQKNLAVFAPQIGAISETFINRHMTELAADHTVVITGTKVSPYAGNWTINQPTLCFEDLQNRILLRGIGFIGRQIGLNIFSKHNFVKSFLKKHKVGVILSEYLDLSLEWVELAQKLDIPFYAHAHGYDVSERLRDKKWQEKYLQLNKIAGIITINQISKQRLIDIGIEPTKIHIIPYGIHIPELVEKPVNSNIKCLAVGRVIPKKAPIFLLEAFRQASEQIPNLTLDLVGAGELLPAAQQFVQAFNLENKVTLHGAKSNDFVQDLMSKSDIFLQHSITDQKTGDEEGLPVAILEAMAFALPVVSTLHAGIPEEVVHGETGFLVKEGDISEMAAKILKLASDSNLRINFGKAGWQRAKQQFSWQKERNELVKLLGLGQVKVD